MKTVVKTFINALFSLIYLPGLKARGIILSGLYIADFLGVLMCSFSWMDVNEGDGRFAVVCMVKCMTC